MAKAALKKVEPAPVPVDAPAGTEILVDAPSTPEPDAPKAWGLDIASPPFVTTAGGHVARLTMAPLTYAEYCDMFLSAGTAAQAGAKAGDNEAARLRRYAKMMSRERVKRRLKAWDASGNPVPLSEGDILRMPRVYAAKVIAASDAAMDSEPGEVLSQGDGISAPILYRLGTPLRTGGQDPFPIEELEFSARTYGDIEEVLAGESPMAQALLLIQTCAKPVGGPVQLQALPSWAVTQIAIADGLKIATDVLPSFLD